MNVNVYLPDELGARAKEEDLPFSQLLRDAVIAELERRATVSKTLAEPQEYLLDIENENGDVYRGRIIGTQIANESDTAVYLTDDERVIVHDEGKLRMWELQDPAAELENFNLSPEAYADAMFALGETPVIDL